jgi:hypothetical protein
VNLARFDAQHNEASAAWEFQVLTKLLAPRSSPLDCQIQLVGETEAEIALPITFFDILPAEHGTWKPGDMELNETAFSLPPDLTQGTYHWTLSCPEGATYTAPDTMEIPADGDTTYLRRRVDVVYGDLIALQGYRWRTVGADLHVTLRWEALERPDVDYKAFVHLLDAEGELVQQYDAMPCDWQCPTSGWQPGEVIVDEGIVPLWGLGSGEYRLAVGLYDTPMGERLPVHGPPVQPAPDGYFLLPDTFQILAEIEIE